MLDELHVQNVALYSRSDHRARAGPHGGNGETGAGKTALLSAIVAQGERVRRLCQCEGAQGAVVEGRFFLPADADNADDGHIACRVSPTGAAVSIDGSINHRAPAWLAALAPPSIYAASTSTNTS